MRERERATEEVVRRWWAAIDRRDWEQAAELLDRRYMEEWPQSRERIVGRENFIAINAGYPGSWAVSLTRVLVDGAQVATEARLTNREDPARTDVAVSFFTLRDGLIVRQTTWWPEPYEAPVGRERWVERME